MLIVDCERCWRFNCSHDLQDSFLCDVSRLIAGVIGWLRDTQVTCYYETVTGVMNTNMRLRVDSYKKKFDLEERGMFDAFPSHAQCSVPEMSIRLETYG